MTTPDTETGKARRPRALITGAAGFAGSHLADLLVGRGDVEVHGILRPDDGTHHLGRLGDRIYLHRADLRDDARVSEVLRAVEPDMVFHLAAQAAVGPSWERPADTLVGNIIMQLHLLQAIVAHGQAPRILVVGSADEYGLVTAADLPIDEDTPLRPLNPYAVSKIAQDMLGYQYHLSHGLHIVRVRPFNHIGPRQGLGFVVPDFARQIARIEAGLQEPVMRVGDLSARRDFTDVRDMVRAYVLVLERAASGAVYNIGSSRSHTIHEVLDTLLRLSTREVRVEVDAERLRPSDVREALCDCRRLRADTGWEPTIDLEQSLRDVLDYWRERVRA
jgi:GDP-4-dehydro-6-deoxy-D-mannose reductase